MIEIMLFLSAFLFAAFALAWLFVEYPWVAAATACGLATFVYWLIY